MTPNGPSNRADSRAAAETVEDPPTISIIMPVFNGAAGIDASLAAIDRQSFQDFEFLIVDDGSTDATAEALRKYADMRPKVNLQCLPTNMGVAVARNMAVARARGRYVWFVDHDDDWSEDFLRVMVAAALETDADVVMCAASSVPRPGVEGRPLEGGTQWSSSEPGRYMRGLLTGDIKGYLWNKLFRRELLGSNPFPPLSSQSDFAGQVLLAERVTRVVAIPDALYRHVARQGSITKSTPKMHNLLTCVQIVDLVVEDPPVTAEPALLQYFRLWFGSLAIVNTALRLQARDTGSKRIATEARRAITWSDILAAWRYSPRHALRASVIRAAWPLYVLIYGCRRWGYDVVRRWRMRGA